MATATRTVNVGDKINVIAQAFYGACAETSYDMKGLREVLPVAWCSYHNEGRKEHGTFSITFPDITVLVVLRPVLAHEYDLPDEVYEMARENPAADVLVLAFPTALLELNN